MLIILPLWDIFTSERLAMYYLLPSPPVTGDILVNNQ